MEQKIKELTLLLLYLTSWEEDCKPYKFKRSWKGYNFEILDKLKDQGFINMVATNLNQCILRMKV
ncbi:hypothetical protein [Clostridium sp. BJN0013]|uniref:DUF6429 family protein n=1 Tax=Clostridium sp. BJN0013 TaxID=3236840 RepID=UPI0034C5DF9F